MADDYRKQLRARFTIVTNRRGAWVANPGWPGGEVSAPLASSIREAMAGRPHHGNASIGGELFLIVYETGPVRGGSAGDHDRRVRDRRWRGGGAGRTGARRREPGGRQSPDGEQPARRAARRARRPAGRAEAVWRRRTWQPASSDLQGPAAEARNRSPAAATSPAHFRLRPDAARRRSAPRALAGLAADAAVSRRAPTSALMAGTGIFGLAVGRRGRVQPPNDRPLKDIARPPARSPRGNWARKCRCTGAPKRRPGHGVQRDDEPSPPLAEEAEERAKRLETSYERFHSVTESARDAIVSTNPQGPITFWNRSAAEIFGYDEADALGAAVRAVCSSKSDRPLYLEAPSAGFGTPRATAARRSK